MTGGKMKERSREMEEEQGRRGEGRENGRMGGEKGEYNGTDGAP